MDGPGIGWRRGQVPKRRNAAWRRRRNSAAPRTSRRRPSRAAASTAKRRTIKSRERTQRCSVDSTTFDRVRISPGAEAEEEEAAAAAAAAAGWDVRGLAEADQHREITRWGYRLWVLRRSLHIICGTLPWLLSLSLSLSREFVVQCYPPFLSSFDTL